MYLRHNAFKGLNLTLTPYPTQTSPYLAIGKGRRTDAEWVNKLSEDSTKDLRDLLEDSYADDPNNCKSIMVLDIPNHTLSKMNQRL